ncbi:MAG: sigma-54-dependent Fis family transcriptional regulator [Gammaproteobacteria bacterium]|nr:sigma-54-dependent Fis family transcriptional regulator [Gammaproteobacteria bacterium]
MSRNRSPILVVEDDESLRQALCDTLGLAGYEVTACADGSEALAFLARSDIAMVVTDIKMAPMDGHALLKQIKSQRRDLPVLLMTAHGSIQQAVEAMRDGAVDYLVKPFEAEVLVNTVSRYLPDTEFSADDPVAVDPLSKALLDKVLRVAKSEATVMISGESGSGKEVIARYIHRHSKRSQHPFVAINCAAIPENMLEATLFGYEKGAFTGAYQACPGKFEQAQSGTLLLDEISEMDLGLQAKLLRVLQEWEVERLGGRKTITLDVRVLATSNRLLRQEVAAGRFREDLYYRLNVIPVEMAPLRQRRQDILPLVEYLIHHHCTRQARIIPTFSTEAQTSLEKYDWPGNVRELDNVLQRALILQPGEVIDVPDLQFESIVASVDTPTPVHTQAVESVPVGDDSLGEDLRSHEQLLILEALRTAKGQRKAAASQLGISERTLRYKLARMRDDGVELPAAGI